MEAYFIVNMWVDLDHHFCMCYLAFIVCSYVNRICIACLIFFSANFLFFTKIIIIVIQACSC